MSLRSTVLAILLAGSGGMPTSATGDAFGCGGGGGGVGASRPSDPACAKAGIPYPIRASALEDDNTPDIRVGRQAYDVRLAAVNGAHEGALQFTSNQAATHDVYVGTPNIPFRVVWKQRTWDGYGYQSSALTAGTTAPITANECAHLRKVMSYDLADGQAVRIEFGPTTAVRFVRLYVDIRTASPPTCGPTSLAQESQACTAATEGARPLAALPLGMPVVAPVLEVDTVYDVELPGVLGTSAYAGVLQFPPPQSDNYELYLDDASIPLRIQGTTPVCSRYIPSTECGSIRRGTRFALNLSLGEYTYRDDGTDLGNTYRVEFGPSASRHVRVTMRQVTAPDRPIKLGPAQTYPVARAASYLSAGDLDGDGALDLVVSSPNDASGDNVLDILRGSGTGAFTSVTRLGVSVPFETMVSDFNRDGIEDIVAVAWDGQGPLPWSYMQGLGDFKYTQTRWHSSIDFNTSLAAGDFNEDGALDLVATWPGFPVTPMDANWATFPNSPLSRDGSTAGGFVIATMPSMTVVQNEPAYGYASAQAVAGDFNGDGHQDVIAASSTVSAVKLYLGDGSGTVSLAADIALPGRGIKKVTVFDLDRDGRSDLLAVHHDPMITISHGSTLGLSSAPIVVPAGHELRGFGLGDFDHDGRTDLAVGNESAIQVFFANDSGYRSGGELTRPPGSVSCMVTGDFTGDGFDDLAVTMYKEGIAGHESVLAVWPSMP